MVRKKKGSVFDYEAKIPQKSEQEPEIDENYWNAILENPVPDITQIHTTVDEFDTPTSKRNEIRIRRSAMASKMDEALEKYKANPTLIRNPILGWRSKEVIEEALRRGAIHREIHFGNEYWSIPTEMVMKKDHKGNMIEARNISEVYIKFMQELDGGDIKINKKGMLL